MKRRKVIFCRIGWMNNYKGIDDDCVGGGFEWVKKHRYGAEMFNFLPFDGILYGYFALHSFVVKGINLERIDFDVRDNEVEDVLVIFHAARPRTGQVIIGWYKDATVFRTYQTSAAIRDLVQNKYEGILDDWVGLYLIQAKFENSFLLPTEERRFIVPRQKHFTGQSNVWYCDSENPATQNYVAQVIDYIDNHKSGARINSKYFLKILPRVDIPMVTPDMTNFNLIKDLKAKLAKAPDDVDTLKKIAKIHMDSENYRWAIKYIRRALELTSTDWELYNWSGSCKEYNDDLAGAESDYLSASKLAHELPDKAEILNGIGNLYFLGGEDIEKARLALECYEKAVALDPEVSAYHYNKGNALCQLKYYETALESMIRAFEIEPDDEDVIHVFSLISDEFLKSKNRRVFLKEAFIKSKCSGKIVESLASYYLDCKENAKANKVRSLIEADNSNNVGVIPEASTIKPEDKSVISSGIVLNHNTEKSEYSSPSELFANLENTIFNENGNSVIGRDISREKYLEEEIHTLIRSGILFRGELEVYDVKGQPYGRQFPTDIGRLDILCRNKKTDTLVVIEIKKGKSADQVIGQISRYMGYVRRNIARPGQVVEGIIIAFDADKKLEYAMLAHDNIKIFTYHVNIDELPRD